MSVLYQHIIEVQPSSSLLLHASSYAGFKGCWGRD